MNGLSYRYDLLMGENPTAQRQIFNSSHEVLLKNLRLLYQYMNICSYICIRIQNNMSVTLRRIPAGKLAKIAEVLKTIGHPVRIEILSLLESHERLTENDIQEKISTDIEQSMLSHHLIKMKDKGVLKCEKEGLYVYYSLKEPNITGLLDCMSNCKL